MIASALVWLKRIRNTIGFLGMLLPWVALLGSFLVSKFGGGIKPCFWEDLSISATYYVTPALAGILTTAAVVLMCYDGYGKTDDILTTLAGVCGLLIVLFPCDCCIIDSKDKVGMFQLEADISHIIHSVSAVCFFLLLSYISICRFTKTHQGKENERTKQKIKRDTIYRICGYGMLAALILMPLPIHFFAKTFIVETIALTFFGISWLVKGQAFGLLADEE
ncbi:MAG: hypothetical protein J6U04_08250 [Salinivirgaceae bacterium]|nr:hypothetical protein [Salinivirgaceae bacterium]